MIKDSERGLGGLLGHEEPETKAQRVRDIKRQIESSIRPLSNPNDVYTNLPFSTELSLATTNVTPPVEPRNKFGHTRAQKEKMILDQITKPKPMPITKYISKMNSLYGSSEVEEEKPKILSTPMGQVKVINSKKSMPQQLTDLKNYGMNKYVKKEFMRKTESEKKKKTTIGGSDE